MALTKVTGDFIKDGVLTQAHLHSSHGITSTHIGEGDKLFFTNARARGAISVSGNALSYNSSTGVITSNFEESPTFTGNVSVSGTTFLDGDVTIGDTSSAFIGMARAGANYLAATNSSGELLFRTAGTNLAFTLDTNQNAIFASAVWMPDYLYHHGDADTYMGYPTNNEWKVTVGGSTKIFADSNKAYLYYQGGLKFQTTSGGIEVTGDADVSGEVQVGGQGSNFSENNLRFKSSGAAYIDHNTTGQSFIFRTSASSSLDTTALTIASNGNATFVGNVTASSGTGHFSVVNASAYQLNGTYVMDSSRNLVNIAAITASGDIVAPGIYVGSANTSYDFYNNGTTYLNSTVTVDADLNFTAGDFNIGGVRIVGDNDSADQGTAFIRSNGDYLVMSAADGEHVYLNWDSSNGGSGHVYVDNALYAQIFYDRNNTGYYVNPNAGSKLVYLGLAADPNTSGGYRLNMGGSIDMNANDIDHVNQLHFNDNVRFLDDGNDSYLRLQSGDSTTTGIKFYANSGNNFKGYIYGDNSGFGLLDSDGNWSIRIPLGGSGVEYRSDNNVSFTINNDHTLAHGSSRAPLFYDSNDTNYYVNPAGDSVFYGDLSFTLGAIGSIADGSSTANQVSRIVFPQGGAGSWDSGQTGAIKITLPIRANNNMWTMKVRIYNYNTNQSEEYFLGNYSYSNGGYNSHVAYHGGESSSPKNVRFGNDGSLDCVWIGETNSSWSYPVVSVLDFQSGFRSSTIANNIDGYNVSIVTSFDTVQTTISPNTKAGSVVYAQQSFRAPIFYDSDNTSYYTDPNSTTSLRTIGSWRADSSSWDGEFNGKIQHHGSYWYMQSANGVFIRNSSGANNITLLATGVGIANNDWRAPYFYDSNDTTYYLDPAGTSITRAISIMQGSGLNLYQSGNGAYAYQDARAEGSYSAVYKGTNNGSAYGAYREYWYDGDSYHSLQISGNRWYFNAPLSVTNDVRAPIFYDSDNTGFYIDGAATSRLDTIMLRSTIQFPTNNPGTTHGSSHRPAYGIYQEGSAWSSPFPDLVIAMHTGIKLGANASYNGIRFYTDYDMSTRVMAVNDSSSPAGSNNVYVDNTLLTGSSLRAPIFYDSNNTNFYTRPSTSSLINHLYTDGTIQAGTSGTGNIYLGNNGGNGTGNHFRFHTNNSHTYFDGNCGDIHWRQGSSTRFIFYMTTANMTVNGTVTQNSDERIKENIITIDSALNKVNQLRGVYYNRTDINTSQKQIGLIAQEVENVIPEAVLTANDELGTKSISYGQINALLIEAIKEQQTIIDDLKSRIETLENQ